MGGCDDQANQNLVRRLKGKLLIAHGTLDDNVPPNNTIMVVDEVNRKYMAFDLILMTNRRHGFGNESCIMRRLWGYTVAHVMGPMLPKEYEFGAAGRP